MRLLAKCILMSAFLLTNNISAQEDIFDAQIAGVTKGYLVPYSYEEAKERGENMSLIQLRELKSKLIELISKQLSDSTEESIILCHSHSVLVNGLYFYDKNYLEETFNEVKSNLLLSLQNRGDKQWNREDSEDRIFDGKFALYRNLLEDILYASIREKDYDFCLHMLQENYAVPFIESQRTVTRFLIELYNKEDLSLQIKLEAEKIFDALICIEKKTLEENIGQEDFIRSLSGSRALLKVLTARKDETKQPVTAIP